MGVVEFGTSVGSTTNNLPISMAGAVCLFAGDWRISLHRRHAASADRVVVDQVVSANSQS